MELEQGNAEAALDRARRAARLDAMDPAAFLLEGAAHEALEDLPAAIVAYERADRLEPTEESTDRLARLNERVRLAMLPPEVQAISDKSTVTRGEVAALVGVRFSEPATGLGRRAAGDHDGHPRPLGQSVDSKCCAGRDHDHRCWVPF